MVRAAVVWMIVADLVLAVAFDVAVLVAMLTAGIMFRLFGLRCRRIDLRDRRRRSRRRSRRRRRAAGCCAKKNQADGHEPGGKPRPRGSIVLVTHKTPHGLQVSGTRMSGATLQNRPISEDDGRLSADLSSQSMRPSAFIRFAMLELTDWMTSSTELGLTVSDSTTHATISSRAE